MSSLAVLRISVALALVTTLAGCTAAPAEKASNSPLPSPSVAPTIAALPALTRPTSVPATATAVPTASPMSAVRYVNVVMGYSIELSGPWHRASCGSSTSGPLDGRDGVDLFIPIPERDLQIGDVGGAHTDTIDVLASHNPTGLTPREWERTGRLSGVYVPGSGQDTTFAARSALVVDSGVDVVFVVANGSYMYQVHHRPVTQVTSSAERTAIVRTFRFLTDDEARAARPSPTATPSPRSPEQVADALAQGLASRDIGVLVPVASRRCFAQGFAQAGASSIPGERYLEMLRDRFARGLTVDVQARPVTTMGAFGGTFFVRSTWHEPGQPDRDTDLMIAVEDGVAYWVGTITYVMPRPT